MGLAGVSYGMSATLASMFLPELYGTKHLGSLKALVEATMICATAASPVFFGWMFDADLSVSLLGWSGLFCLGLAQCGIMAVKCRNRI